MGGILTTLGADTFAQPAALAGMDEEEQEGLIEMEKHLAPLASAATALAAMSILLDDKGDAIRWGKRSSSKKS